MLPTSRPRVGWSRTSSVSLRLNSRATIDLLLVAAGQRRRPRRSPTGSGCRTRRSPASPTPRSPRRSGGAPARTAPRRTGSARGCPRAGTSGRARTDGGRPARTTCRAAAARAGPDPVTSCPARRDGPARRLAQARERLDELVLAVAGDAGDSEDLAGADLEADAIDGLLAAIVRDPQVRDDRVSGSPGWISPRSTTSWTSRPTISSARSSSSVSAGIRDPDDLAAPDDRDPVGDLEHLVELVADEDDAVALVREAPQDGEDLLRLLWREHGRRLVEDEDPRLAVERLEDLDPLLPADRQRADLARPGRSRSRSACRARRSGGAPPPGRGRPGWPSSPRRGGCSRRPSARARA